MRTKKRNIIKHLTILVLICIVLQGIYTTINTTSNLYALEEKQVNNAMLINIRHLDNAFENVADLLSSYSVYFLDDNNKLTPEHVEDMQRALKNIDTLTPFNDTVTWCMSKNKLYSAAGLVKSDICFIEDMSKSRWEVTPAYSLNDMSVVNVYIYLDADTIIGTCIPVDSILQATEIISESDEIQQASIWIIDQNGNVLGDKSPISADNSFGRKLTSVIRSYKMNFYTSDGIRYVGKQSIMVNSKWRIIAAIPYTSIINNTRFNHFLYTILIFSLMLLLGTVAYCTTERFEDSKYDTLTSAYRYEIFVKKTERKIKRSKIQSYYICQMNIHNFHIVNERSNYETGDKLLKRIYKILCNALSSNAVIGRKHSDIFCFSFPYISESDLQAKLNEIDIKVRQLEGFNLTASFGIYKYSRQKDRKLSVNTACDYANAALKETSGNSIKKVYFFDDFLKHNIEDEYELCSYMNTAIEEKQFKIYLQPKYSITQNKIVGAEALVRWEHPEKGTISPARFIPIFEQNGFIQQLDEYMWEGTAAIIRKWIDEGRENIVPISVNISRAQKLGSSLCDKIINITQKYNIPIEYLQLEFTESVCIENINEFYDTIKKLRDYGFTLLMDDFGSGYSSLNMLKDCPMDIIKLDKDFFKRNDTGIDLKGTVIVKMIIKMIKALNLDIVAEGVEIQEHVDLLESCGCDTIQGFFFSPPVKLEEFEEKLFQ